MKKFLLALVFSLLVATAGAQAAVDFTLPFNQIIAFGDSYSDNGFVDGQGFARETEALSWVEYTGEILGIPTESWAWAGAESGIRNCNHPKDVNWSGLTWQVDEYTKALKKGQDISKILFTVMVGSNDVWGGATDPVPTVDNIYKALAKLAKAGAKHILYRETMNVLLSPGYLEGDYVSYSEPWAKFVGEANVLTQKKIAEDFAKEFPDVKIYYAQTNPLFTKIKNKEKGFKFEIIDKPWSGTYTFPTPYKYLWFDLWHPTAQANKLIADDTVDTLKAALK